MILVTGANGFVGSHLTPRLVKESGHPVRALARPGADTRALEKIGVEIARGNVTQPDTLAAALRGVDYVVHLVAVPLERGKQTFEAVNVNGTRNLATAAKAAGVKRYVQMSALGASNQSQYPYTYSKWLGDEAVRASGLRYTIFQPSAQFGEGDGFFSAFAGLINISPLIFPSPGKGDTVFQPIWVEDVASAVLRVICDETVSQRTLNQTVEMGGPEHLTYDEMVRAVLRAMGKSRTIVHVPLPLMRVPVALFSLLPYPPVDSGQLDLLNVRNSTDLDSMPRWFGIEPRPLAQGLDYLKLFDELAWLRERFSPP